MFDRLLSYLFPPKCIFCNKLISPKARVEVCTACYKKLPFYHKGSLVTSGMYIDALIPLFSYTGPVRQSLVRYKFFDKPSYYRTYAILLSQRITENMATNKIDFIVSVPLHKMRQWDRGYNQAALIARYISRKLDIPDYSFILERVVGTKQQSLLSKYERSKNIKNAFRVKYPKELEGKNILLVDDIFTTGNTVDECARVLKAAGALRVIATVLACAAKKDLIKREEIIYSRQ